MKRFFSLLTISLLGACASGGMGVMDGIMNSWIGVSADDVMRQWGYPHEDRVIAGKHLLIWNRNIQLALPSTATTTGSVSRIGQTAYYAGTTTVASGGISNWGCTRLLEVDQNNMVINFQWEGNNCPFMEVGPYSNWRKK